jgi:hypothetical protein
MMFGFGDDQNPYTESVDLLEDLVIEYITETVGLLPSKLFQTVIPDLLSLNFIYQVRMQKCLFLKSNANVSSCYGNSQRVGNLIRIL